MELLAEGGTQDWVGPDAIDQSMSGSADQMDAEASPSSMAMVKRICARIREDKRYHKDAFQRMKNDMFMAFHGRDRDWSDKYYRANIAGRHVKRKTESLYAKNPKVVCRRRETLDFRVWDESPSSLKMALQAIEMAQQAVAATPMTADPVTGQPVPAQDPIPPMFQQAFMQAQELMADYQQGMVKRKMAKQIGRTLEVLFSQAMREQVPLDFKQLLKTVVRRACTTGVGYIEVGFQRTYGPRQGLNEQLSDARARLDHLQHLSEELFEGELGEDTAEMYELQASIRALQEEPDVVLREGLVFDAPMSTRVIPDKLCRQLVGFVGARHVTMEYLFTRDQVEEMFPGVDIGDGFRGYSLDGDASEYRSEYDYQTEKRFITEDYFDGSERKKQGSDLICVWKHYDKMSGLVYYVADGYKYFLREPAPPDVFVETFWPVFALTFNGVENETELFPPSDVGLLRPMQDEHNRSRQGKREHRIAARPRWAGTRGTLEDTDLERIEAAKPFETILLDKNQETSIKQLLEPFPVPGVDPNLYDTNETDRDMELAVGTNASQLGGVSKATATESAIAASSSASADNSSIDDLDNFLTTVARAAGQVLLREMSADVVQRIVGPGAVWPELTLQEISDELYLEVEAGSTGKPNQAVEINNWKALLPMLVQMPGIEPTWLARETLRRLDDRLDLTEALTEGLPSIVFQNAMRQAAPAQPGNAPEQQGAKGDANAPKPTADQGAGSGPAFGSNQVAA